MRFLARSLVARSLGPALDPVAPILWSSLCRNRSYTYNSACPRPGSRPRLFSPGEKKKTPERVGFRSAGKIERDEAGSGRSQEVPRASAARVSVHAMQRLKTCAKRGAEIGLKARSQPGGICANGRVCNGAAGNGAASDGSAGDPSSGRTAGPRTGSRSALWERLTATVRPVRGKPAPVVGNDGTETSPAANNASETAPTPARRTEKIPNIGLAPELRHGSPSPQMRARPVHPRAKRTWPAAAGSVLFAQSPPCDRKARRAGNASGGTNIGIAG